MTNQQPPESHNNPPESSLTTRIFNVVKQPKTQIVAGVTLVAIALAGYTGTRYVVTQIIPAQVEKELKKLSGREVDIGEITEFSLNSLKIENTNILSTPKDPSFLEIDNIDADFNLLSILFKGSLPVNIVVDNVTGNIQLDTLTQSFPKKEPEKKALPDTLKLPPLPITPEINLLVENVDLALSPNTQTEPIEVKAQADLDLLYNRDTQPLNYNLSAQIEDNNEELNLRGTTLLSTTGTKMQVNVTNLHARRGVDFIPQLPLDLETGEINANLDIEIPSLPDILQTSANGSVTVRNVVGKIDLEKLPNSEDLKSETIKALQQPLTADAYLRFQGQSLNIESLMANWGNLGGEVTGSVDVNQGYNLEANLQQFKIGNIIPVLSLSLPVKVDGLLAAKVIVTGEIDNPQIKGDIGIDNTIVDKVDLGKIQTNFSANLDEVVLDKLTVKPKAGGEVMAMGLVKTNLRETLTEGKEIDINQFPLQLNFTADLPTAELIAPYSILPPEISIGNLQLIGEVKGKLSQPTAKVNWQIPSANGRGIGEISGGGELTVTENKVNLTNTKLIANDGTITVDGNADLKTKKFAGNLSTNGITLTPFLTQFCSPSRIDTLPICHENINLNRPIIVNNVDVDVKGKLDKISLDTINAVADADLNIDGGKVLVNSLLSGGNLEAKAEASQIPIDSFFPTIGVTTTLVNSDINIRGDIAELLKTGMEGKIPDSININGDTNLKVGDGMVNALVNLDKENTTLLADVKQIPLQSLIPSLAATTTINKSQVNASLKTQDLFSFVKNQSSSFDCQQSAVNCFPSLNVNSNFNADVGDGNVDVTATIKNGFVNVNTFTENLDAQEILPTFPVNANNIDTQVKLNAELSDLITAGVNYLDTQTISPIPSLNLVTDTNLNVAQGNIDLQAQVNNNQWQAEINTRQINLENLAQQLEEWQKAEGRRQKDNSQIPTSVRVFDSDSRQTSNTFADLPPLDSQIKLSGNILSLLSANPSAEVKIDSANLQLGENNIIANGNVNLVNLLTQPDVANLQLNVVKANLDLANLPTNSVLDIIPPMKGVNFIPSEVNLSGKANFQGVINGKNLLTNPLGKDNLNLNGNLTLNNLNFNDLQFEPVLTGKVNINPSDKTTINLRGKEDVIAAEIVPTNITIPNSDIMIPYIPNSIKISQGDYPNNLDVEGYRQGNQFIATINNFNLDSLNLSPLTNYGFVGNLTGNVETEVAVNLTDFTGKGKIKLTDVGVGNIIADKLTADINYQGDIVELNSAAINFGETSYDLQAKLNFVTQDINAKVDLEGDVKDIFDTLKISDITTITALITQLQTKDYFANPSAIPIQSLGSENDSIKTQINLLYNIDQQIKALAQKIEAGTIPDALEITGKYEGEVIIGGKLTNPTASIDFEGNKWQWLPQQDFPNIVQSLGLILEETQSIPIPKLVLKADLQNKELTVKPFQINIGKSQVYFAGDLSQDKQEGEFRVKNFSLDLVKNFVPTPVDVEGTININGKLAGNYTNPQIDGKIDIENASVEGAILEEKISGDFNYQDYIFNFATTFPEEIQVTATLPYHPLVEIDAPANINVNLNTDAIALLDVLTQGQIQLTGGEAKANLSVETASIQDLIDNLDFKTFELDDILEEVQIRGNIEFNEAKITSIALSEPVYLTGNAKLLGNKQAIEVENLQAKVKEAEINIAGILPLIKPLKNNPTPLTVDIPQQQFNLEELYSGQVGGNIQIQGTALTPQVGGYVALNKGNIKLVNKQTVKSAKNSQLWYQWLGEVSQETEGIFQPHIKDFKLVLSELQLAQWGLYRFAFDGNLVVNGPVLELENLRAEGAVNLRRGQIYLGGATPVGALSGTGQTTFYLARTNENKITFNPNQPILNPNIDLVVQADVTDYSRQLPATQRNEIPEPIIRGGRGETIRVELLVNGGLQQLLPALAGNVNQFCGVNSKLPIAEEIQLSSQQLEKVAKCVNIAALNAEGSNLGLLNSPLVQLRSTPNRSEGELINLIIGGQLINIASQLQNLSGDQLFETGFVQFVLVPLANNVGFGVNETVSTWGQPLGMKDLRVFPLVEGVYELPAKSNFSVSYDYIYSEFKVRYQMRF